MVYRIERLGLTLLLGLLLLVQPSSLSSQASSQQKNNPVLPRRVSNQTYRVTVDLVNILCSVRDKNSNTFVTTLTRDDFAVYEDNKKQEIKNFIRETNLPLTIAMLIDTSTSVAPKLRFEQEAATSFFQSILKEKDRAMLVEFDSGFSLVQDFTNDPNKLANEIRKLKAAGGTALYDAIAASCDEKLIRETGRKSIVIISDGQDESSKTTREKAIEMALRAEATIFAISVSKGGFSGVSDTDEGDKILEEMAQKTGGRVFYPFKVDELYDAFQSISQELRSQYSIGYISTNTNRDGSYRKIEMKTPGQGYRLSYRKGYFAPSS